MKLKLFSKSLGSNQRFIPRYKILTIFILAALVFSGCSKKIEIAKFTVTEGQKKFEDKCLKDYNLHVRTRQVGRTFWIYLPIKTPIFDYEVQKNQAPASASDSSNGAKYSLNFVDGKFQNNIFSFEYDIVDKKKTKEEDYGFNSSYTDSYSKIKYNLYTSIYEVFLNIKPKEGELTPQFFVAIISDINKGIETRSTFFLQDFMRAMSGEIPNDEYVKRFIEDRKGSTSIIGDETGSHIKYSDITMGEFLTKQVLNRIRFKFQYSDFAPKADNDHTIIGLVADTLRYYHFENFTNIRLNNLRLGKKYLFDKPLLVNFGDDKPKENKGRLVHIRFEDGKPEFNEEPSSDQTDSPSPVKDSQ